MGFLETCPRKDARPASALAVQDQLLDGPDPREHSRYQRISLARSIPAAAEPKFPESLFLSNGPPRGSTAAGGAPVLGIAVRGVRALYGTGFGALHPHITLRFWLTADSLGFGNPLGLNRDYRVGPVNRRERTTTTAAPADGCSIPGAPPNGRQDQFGLVAAWNSADENFSGTGVGVPRTCSRLARVSRYSRASDSLVNCALSPLDFTKVSISSRSTMR